VAHFRIDIYKYALKDLLLISGLPKSVYYYYEQRKETDKYHDIKILISEIFDLVTKHMAIDVLNWHFKFL